MLIPNTHFEPRVNSGMFDTTLNVSGTFVTMSGQTATPDICSAGLLCVPVAPLQSKGYPAGVLNENTWQFAVAADGVEGLCGNIFAFDSYDIQRVGNGQGDSWAVGARTLGLELQPGQIGDFCQIETAGIKVYAFGSGNFTTLPSSDADVYFTIVNGLLVAKSTAPAEGAGLYFKLISKGIFTEGTQNAFDKYICRAMMAPVKEGSD